jgi:hypothetical protein
MYMYVCMHQNIKYTLEKETNQILNYLDLKPLRHSNSINMGINHKTTQTGYWLWAGIVQYVPCTVAIYWSIMLPSEF